MSKSRKSAYNIHRYHQKKFGRIIVLTGARQVGKTTLLKEEFSDYNYISLDDPTTRSLFSSLTTSQWIRDYPKAILDEIQKEPSLMEMMKSAYDTSSDVKYLLTGSSQLMLMSQVKESLAGRCIITEMYPLTLPELMTEDSHLEVHHSLFQNIILGGQIPESMLPFRLDSLYERKIQAYSHYLKYGGYPAISTTDMDEEDRRLWLKNYQQTYLERDIRDLADFKQLEPFVAIQKISATLTGQVINYSLLAKEAKIHLNTAKRFIQYISMSYQAFLLMPWHKNELKRLSKVPKIHFLDPGIQRTIVNNHQGDLSGHEFESAIISEIYKQLKYLDLDYTVYHLRTNDGREVDLLIEVENGYYAFEIKQTRNYKHTDTRHLRNLAEILDKPLIHSFVLCQDEIPNFENPNIKAIHAAQFLS